MRYACKFENRSTGECRTIVATLSQTECQSIEDLRRHSGGEIADVTAEAYALSRAYREVATGFRHTESPKLMLLA
ncbi:MAG: hypothetical protein ABI407_11460 [Bradyrhizobium sp.]